MRSELFHSMSIHFPVAFIVLLFGVRIALFFIKSEEKKSFLSSISFILLTLSMISTFVSIYLGDMAFEIIRPNLCKIGKVDFHEDSSKILALILFVSLFIETLFLVFEAKMAKKEYVKVKNIIILFLIIISLFFLYQTAHSGAMLVYEQGAGVLNHPKNCQ